MIFVFNGYCLGSPLHLLIFFHCCDRSDEERETWGFLKVMFEDDGTARTKLLTHLGFSVPIEENEAALDDLTQEVNALGLEETATEKVGTGANNESTVFPADNGEDFFNNLPSPKTDSPVSTPGGNFAAADISNGLEKIPEELEVEESSDPTAFDDDVQRALVVGDYKVAVELCISANKWADALVIAHVGSASLWEHTRDQYLKKIRSPYLKVADIYTICYINFMLHLSFDIPNFLFLHLFHW